MDYNINGRYPLINVVVLSYGLGLGLLYCKGCNVTSLIKGCSLTTLIYTMWRGDYRQIQIPQPSKIPSKNRVSPHTATTYNVYIPVTHRISPHMLYHSQD